MFRLQIIELLLIKPGIKVNAANNEGDTALDILQQIPARGNDANGAVGQIAARDNDDEYVAVHVVSDSFGRRMAIIQQLKARKGANPPSLTDMQTMQITVAGFILTATFQAILSPPGGLWQDSGKNHKPGKAIQRETNPGLYTFFMAFNALPFTVSLALILNIMIMRKENSLVVVALVSFIVAFSLSLIMIS